MSLARYYRKMLSQEISEIRSSRARNNPASNCNHTVIKLHQTLINY